ncbi:MAG: Uma2 family endonuclease [Chlorogloeopsis fritschii C42_A2020_084]|uniref:Uma2 family endonuclease n=1 Tax=Chlorogloeopsis fritschii TaxID=1124 RepID=UPI0019EC231E|nr:Uma2 family endonuclease [Chlorogloeopsis fritschii]MBF2005214.1 Uma2 family endonuclease [Chlorogloeopsis fritschii C42_A2020_084]
MTAVTPVVKPVSQMQLAPGSAVTIPNVSWQEFESILQELGEHRSARVAYSQGTLEIMVPLPEHEKPKELISDFVKILLKAMGKRYEPFGSTTFKREGTAGVEPDACFYIQNYQRMIGRRRLQADDPPPDLAIETDVTSKTTLEAYRAIGVPEVWIYESGKLNIYLLSEGIYLKSDSSPNFANIQLTQIIPALVERAWQVGSFQALEEFAEAIAQTIK